ncbi:MAG: polysaccharide biosynthesis tyrosine autokinase [Desulfosalsimonadaceae bacterium]
MGKFSKALDKSSASSGKAAGSESLAESDKTGGSRSASVKTMDQEAAIGAGSSTSAGWDLRLRLSTDPNSRYFENFRRLRGSILYPSSTPKSRTILVTSVAPGEGKGFICANLGAALSQDVEHHALMLDCDFRHPTLARLFGISNETGLVDYLQDDVDLSYLMRKTGQPKLSLIPSGQPPENPSELILSNRMAALFKELAERYPDRLVLVDSPPYTVASETNILAKHLDGVILVIRHGVSKKEHVKKFVDILGRDKIVGLVYNGFPPNSLGELLDKQKGYGYNYYY